MTDSHVHIGQFNDKYYSADEVFDVIFSSGKIERLLYSSTSSCIPQVKYSFVQNEIDEVSKKYSADIAMPLFWFVPDYINQGIEIAMVMDELNYGGFKLHPYINEWNFENDTKQYEILHEIFNYADKRKMQILIHTGESGVDRPNRFERFFPEYKNVKIILAHCRPARETIDMMKKYPNIYGDTAFAPKERIDVIIKAGMGERLIFGTDFPITHYFNSRNLNISMEKQYEIDLSTLLPYLNIIFR